MVGLFGDVRVNTESPVSSLISSSILLNEESSLRRREERERAERERILRDEDRKVKAFKEYLDSW